MKAFLIDPASQTITAVEYDGDYKSITKMVEAQTFTAVQINEEEDTIYLDDEGLFVEDQSFFMVAGYPEPLAGKGLVLGTDDEGDSTEPIVTFDSLLDCVRFGNMVAAHKDSRAAFDPIHPIVARTDNRVILFVGVSARTSMRDQGKL